MSVRIAARGAKVRVPATSGNLGPGFDCFGMAHGLYDDLEVYALARPETRVHIEGRGQNELPTDETNLVIRAIKYGINHVGAPVCGLDLYCENHIPQGRGMGSSAAAVVAGLLLARGIISHPELLSDTEVLQLADNMEGHPDNAAPAIYGQAGISWVSEEIDEIGGKYRQAHWEPIPVHSEIETTVIVPREVLSTEVARSVLPPEVPREKAVFNVVRASLLTMALGGRQDILMEATRDELHQPYRASSMPQTTQLLTALRTAGWPAVVSGAGPSIIVFGHLDGVTSRIVAERGWQVIYPGIGQKAKLEVITG